MKITRFRFLNYVNNFVLLKIKRLIEKIKRFFNIILRRISKNNLSVSYTFVGRNLLNKMNC